MNRQDWFTVDVARRAAKVRSKPIYRVLQELVANSLDAGATNIFLTCTKGRRPGRRARLQGLYDFDVTCSDDGAGCSDPEILRRVGSSTSDISPNKRGRFGQGLIDFLATCESAQIDTHEHCITFDEQGYHCRQVSTYASAMHVSGTMRHDGEGYEEAQAYFDSFILPAGVRLTWNGLEVAPRSALRTFRARLQTVSYDAESGKEHRETRDTEVAVYVARDSNRPKVYELGIPVDDAPWSLPYDVDVQQKTPLDVARDALPATYLRQLGTAFAVGMQDEYMRHARESGAVAPEVANSREAISALRPAIREGLVEVAVGKLPGQIVRVNPFRADDVSEGRELQDSHDLLPVSVRSLPAGIAEAVAQCPTVQQEHDRLCKVTLSTAPDFPAETPQQRQVIDAYQELLSEVVGRPIHVGRMRSTGACAATSGDSISLNIDDAKLWANPFCRSSIAVLVHELAHRDVSGHDQRFAQAACEWGARMAVWAAANPKTWWKLTRRAIGWVE